MSEHSKLQEAFATYKIEAPSLACVIDEAAFVSGDYPHKKPLKTKKYEKHLHKLQIELLKIQDWVKKTGERVVIVFEGRDAAGKGGAIARLTQHLNPRVAHIIALAKPTDEEKAQPYFQRYVKQMPAKGEIAIFDRSWYNRAVVEPVMGFCTPEQTEAFYQELPAFEQQLQAEGIHLIKIWLHVGHAMQLKRLHKRFADPLKHWKLSPVDFASIGKWDAYTLAIESMLARSNTASPWTIIHANDKRRTRLAVIGHILSRLPYPERDEALIAKQPRKIVLTAEEFLAKGGEE